MAEASISGRVRPRALGCAPARVPSRALRVPRHPPESRAPSLVGRDADGRSVLREDRLPGRLRRRTGGPRLRHLGRKTEVREDAPHHGRVLDRGDEVEATAARLAGEDVDRPDAAEQLGPRRVGDRRHKGPIARSAPREAAPRAGRRSGLVPRAPSPRRSGTPARSSASPGAPSPARPGFRSGAAPPEASGP